MYSFSKKAFLPCFRYCKNNTGKQCRCIANLHLLGTAPNPGNAKGGHAAKPLNEEKQAQQVYTHFADQQHRLQQL